MTPVATLLAAADDWVGLLVIVLFVVIPAIGQLIAKMRQQPKPAQQPAAQPAAPPAGGELDDEIGEFLRRAVRRGDAVDEPGRPGAQRPVQAMEAEVVAAEPVGGKVQKHVGEYLNSEKFARRAGELGDEVAHTDQRMGKHLEEVFEHDVGQLTGMPGEAAGAPEVTEAATLEDRVADLPATAAAGLPVLLGSAESIRQAIVISEILGRPEDRWT